MLAAYGEKGAEKGVRPLFRQKRAIGRDGGYAKPMPRKRRLFIPGLPQHVVQRGVDKQAVFFADADCHRYLNTFTEYARKHGVLLHAFCLMTNHVHLLVTASEPNSLALRMQDLGRKYVAQLNKRYNRTGGLWEGRYFSAYIEPHAYLLKTMRYIEMKPVRAGMVETPGDYRWSSFACNAAAAKIPIIEEHELYLALGSNHDERATAYRRTFAEEDEFGSSEDCDALIRVATQQGVLLANSAFAKQVELRLSYGVRPRPRGRPRKEKGV